MHTHPDLDYVVILEEAIAGVSSLYPPDVKQPHLNMGLEGHGTPVVPPTVAIWVQVRECLGILPVGGMTQFLQFVSGLMLGILPPCLIRGAHHGQGGSPSKYLASKGKAIPAASSSLQRNVLLLQQVRVNETRLDKPEQGLILGKEI